ncbi:MAG: DUF2937 family protein [Pseudomonadota bacterium]
MGRVTKSVITTGAVVGAVAFAQTPEFTQQYVQRIGGAVDELTRVVEDFDRDAAGSNLERRQALGRMTTADSELVRSRGRSMSRTIARYERLKAQQSIVRDSVPLLRPIMLAQELDMNLLRATWDDFRPAIPVTQDGIIWLGGGVLFGWLTGLVFTRPLKRRKKTPVEEGANA